MWYRGGHVGRNTFLYSRQTFLTELKKANTHLRLTRGTLLCRVATDWDHLHVC